MLAKFWWGLVKFGFRLLYNEMAWSYDLVSWVVSLGEWRRWQRAALPFLPEATGRILELAHGPGHMLLALEELHHEVHGCDLSRAMGAQARRRLARKGRPARLVRCYVQALPYADQSFTAILSTFPTNYIVDPETLAELYRLLEPAGRVIIVPEGHLTGRTSLHSLIAWLFRATGQQSAHQDEMERRWLTFTEPVRRAGFRVSSHSVSFSRSACTVLLLEKS